MTDSFTAQDVIAKITSYYPQVLLDDLTPKRLNYLAFTVDWLLALKTDCPPRNKWTYAKNEITPSQPLFQGNTNPGDLPDVVTDIICYVVDSTIPMNKQQFYRAVAGLYPLLMIRDQVEAIDLHKRAQQWHQSKSPD